MSDGEWDALDTGGDPFVSRAFLSAAEETGAASDAMGWRAMHLELRDRRGALAGLLPLYLRADSFGDFSWDWNWAAAWHQVGLRYYPKFVTGVPYTPSPGPRLLSPHGSRRVNGELIAAAIEVTREFGASSWQCLFVGDADREALAAAGLLLRRGVQFHWHNGGYRDFADYLGTFTAEKRKKLKRERRAVAEAGLSIETRHGDEIDGPLWKAIHRHYRSTYLRYGNHPAFSLEFFRRVGAALGRRMVVFVARKGKAPVASSVCFRSDDTLFGRHWGSDVDCPGLHFELSYHQGIDYAIAAGLARFEAGSGGEHKLARGFEPTSTWSALWIADLRMRNAVASFIEQEEEAMQDYAAERAAHLPYKADAR